MLSVCFSGRNFRFRGILAASSPGGTLKKKNNIIVSDTVELHSNGPKRNGILTPTDLTFGPKTSYPLILYLTISYDRCTQNRQCSL